MDHCQTHTHIYGSSLLMIMILFATHLEKMTCVIYWLILAYVNPKFSIGSYTCYKIWGNKLKNVIATVEIRIIHTTECKEIGWKATC